MVGGDFENEGTVEVCLDNLWGLIADTGWTDGDAKVVCSQLGYTVGSKHCTLLLYRIILINEFPSCCICIQLLFQNLALIMVNPTK